MFQNRRSISWDTGHKISGEQVRILKGRLTYLLPQGAGRYNRASPNIIYPIEEIARFALIIRNLALRASHPDARWPGPRHGQHDIWARIGHVWVAKAVGADVSLERH
jgi:hypothetical protein